MRHPRTPPRALLGLSLLLFMSAVVSAQEAGGAAAPSPTPVRLEVMLTGGRGRAAPEPKREDVRVFVDGAERPVVSFEREVLPVSYGLVVDNSGSLRTQIGAVTAAAKFVVDQNRPGDRAFVLRFVSSDNISILQGLTENGNALADALYSMRIEGGQTAMLDALGHAGQYLTKNSSREGAPRRLRALILVTDGEDRRSSYKVEEVLKLLKAGGVQVFCVGLTGELERERGFVGDSKRRKAKDLLTKIAKETGGRVFYAEKPRELEEAVGEVVENMRTRYVLSFDPPAPGGGSRGNVEVKLAGALGKVSLKAQIVAPANDKD